MDQHYSGHASALSTSKLAVQRRVKAFSKMQDGVTLHAVLEHWTINQSFIPSAVFSRSFFQLQEAKSSPQVGLEPTTVGWTFPCRHCKCHGPIKRYLASARYYSLSLLLAIDAYSLSIVLTIAAARHYSLSPCAPNTCEPPRGTLRH